MPDKESKDEKPPPREKLELNPPRKETSEKASKNGDLEKR